MKRNDTMNTTNDNKAPEANSDQKPSISFIIPVMNEEESLDELFTRIREQADTLARWWEIIFIDDGSTDASWDVINRLSKENPKVVQALRFRSNQGKAAALNAGYKDARGEYVFTLDADLQDDPAEIPRFLEKLEEGFDIVSGWKKTRHDPWHKVLPSRVFNKMLSKLNGVNLHDHNCGFKLYRRDVVKVLPMYGEMHRMVPSLASIEGFRTAEIPVQHHARKFGYSKYGVKRFLRGFMDMWTVYFLKNFRERPLHLFGGIAALSVALGAVMWGISLFLPATAAAIALGTALPISVAVAVLLLGIGLLTELQVSHNQKDTENDLPVSERITATRMERAESSIHDQDEVNLGFTGRRTAGTALVLEDDKSVRWLVSSYLEKAGWTVKTAENIGEAMEITNEEIDVAFVDIHLPDGDGITFLDEFAILAPGAKAVMLSSETDLHVGVEAMKAGAFDYLNKPVRPDAITTMARRALNSDLRPATRVEAGEVLEA